MLIRSSCMSNVAVSTNTIAGLSLFLEWNVLEKPAQLATKLFR